MGERYFGRLPGVRSVLAAVPDRPSIRSQEAISSRERAMKARKTLIGMLVVVVAVLIPATKAAQRDIRPGTAALTSQSSSVRPDDRPGPHGAIEGIARGAVAVRPDDRAGIRGPGTPPPASLVRSSDGFDWQDAFIGGAGGVGIALLLTGALFLVASRRTRTRIA